MYFSAFTKGLAVGASLIIPIGAQNAFVIKQGLKKNHVLATAALCSLIDASLISTGMFGVNKVTSKAESTLFYNVISWAGIIFLLIYGSLSLRDSIRKTSSLESKNNGKASSLWTTIITVLAISLLNPHVYLDTMLLIGSIGNQLSYDDQPFYTIGAIIASFVWFFSLAFGAQKLAPILNKEKSWRLINLIVAIMMFSIATSLIKQTIN